MAVNALIKKASVYAGNHGMDEVTTCFDKCFQLDPECPDALLHKARVRWVRGGGRGRVEGGGM